jgi:hypothetical protein
MNKNKIIWLGIVVFLVVGIIWLVKIPSKSGKLDAFATCIKDSGAIFYGAFWCPTPDGNSQLPICIDAGVESYPTWEYADGTRETGEISLERLSEKTACPLSQEEING